MFEAGSKKFRLIRARINVYEVIAEYRVFGFKVKAVGISIKVMKMIFSIIKDLGFLESRFRGFV